MLCFRFGRGFLGLTVACARCHDHKFDPISTKDYYALAGVFASTDYNEVFLVPPEVVEEKEKTIAVLAARLAKGEALSQLAAEASEDEASKPRGGDLGYIAETRMPAEFMTEIKKLRVGETSKPFRSHLGFHIVQLAETRPARQLSFDEVRPEIFLALANDRRALQVARLSDSLSRSGINVLASP